MVSGKVCWVAGVIALATMGCPREAVSPDAWAGQPVVVSSADAATLTVRLAAVPAPTGRDAAEIESRGSWPSALPEELRGRLEASGFKIAQGDAPADVVLTVHGTNVEWTGRFWEAHGDMVATLGTAGADVAPIAQFTQHFTNIEAQEVPKAVAQGIIDQLVRSSQVATYAGAKRAKEEAAKAPPPPPVAPPPPPPGLEGSAIRPVVAKLRHTLRGCFEAGLASDPSLSGTLALDLAIAPEGKVTGVGAGAASTLKDAGVTACVMDAVKGLTFPQAPGKTEAVVPLEFPALLAPEVKGGLEVIEIRKPIHGSHAKIHACFEPLLKKNADATGVVKVKFSVTTKGAVIGAEVLKDSTIKEKEVDKCLLNVVKGVAFPKPKKKVDVVYPFELK